MCQQLVGSVHGFGRPVLVHEMGLIGHNNNARGTAVTSKNSDRSSKSGVNINTSSSTSSSSTSSSRSMNMNISNSTSSDESISININNSSTASNSDKLAVSANGTLIKAYTHVKIHTHKNSLFSLIFQHIPP